jgi:hypothetical protein
MRRSRTYLMQLRTLAAALFCTLLAHGCSTPKCPRDLIQRGKVCSPCPEGSEKQGNECVDLDAGVTVEPIEADEDAEVGEQDDAGEDAASEDGGSPAKAEYALGKAGETCPAALDQSLACEGHASRKILKCQGGSWQVLQTCGQNERCDSRMGTEQGTCAAIPASCNGKMPGDICDGSQRLTCGIDLVNVTSRACPEHARCTGDDRATCTCDTGYEDDGQGGCQNPNDCPADACKGGKCVDGPGDYSCDCDSGYAGTGSKKCTPVQYCPKDACTPGGTCVDTMNWTCECNTGFSGSGTQACSNQNDCPSDRCLAPNAVCKDQVGSYECACNPGFSGPDCVNDLCNPNPCRNGGTCSRTGTLCSCPLGYSGVNCELDACNPNPCQHGGSCTRTSSGASCNCAGTGYQGNRCETRIDPCSGTTNGCGGSCMTPLANQPNASCMNGLLGACARTGKYVCQGTTTTVCNAPSVAAGVEVCGDNVDNDCDGSIDESDATDARTWYQDCDNDGYARLGASTMRSCNRPAAQSGCASWSSATPVVNVSADCNDASPWYHPGAPFGVPRDGSTSHDLDCDGTVQKEQGVGQAAIDNFSVSSVPLCPLSDTCQVCAQRSTFGGARWLENEVPTTTQPRCSTSPMDGFPHQNTHFWLNSSSCVGGANG